MSPDGELAAAVSPPLDGVETDIRIDDHPASGLASDMALPRRLEVTWTHPDGPVGTMVVYQWPEMWRFARLDLEPGWQGMGINKFLHEGLPELAKGRGVAEFRMSPGDEVSAKAFADLGWVRDGVFMKLVL